jgi:Zn-dependent peptidase ImmA (M78 family)/transcriptional regulator with XRE-family HTH domain
MDGGNAIIASNLTRLRSARGLSQTELARKSGISRVALGKIERAEWIPRADTLEALAGELGVRVRELVTPVPILKSVRFRARKQVQGREEILAEVAAWLHDFAWLEKELGEEKSYRLAHLTIPASPVALAAKAREALGLKGHEPVSDICELFEDNGIRVRLLNRATEAFFGLSVGPDESGPAVVVNAWKRISVERWIFTAAHELGHLLLHSNSFDRNEAYEPSQEEKEADAFAGHFLMPQSFFFGEWERTAGLSFLDRVLKLKRFFRVSYKTVLHRLVENRQVDSKVWQVFQVQHRNRYGKTLGKSDEPQALVSLKRAEEPDRLSDSDFKEDRLSKLVRCAFEQRLISLGRAAEILRLELGEMRQRAKIWAA